jgi:hypothetical protein
MPVSGPCESAFKKSPQPGTAAKWPKKEFLLVLRRAGIPEEIIKMADEQLHDPVDHKRDGIFLVTHGLDRDQLISRMGGSP